MIELRTLGTLELTSADSDAVGSVLAQPRRAALLCYLALALPRGFHRRDTLFALFWPDEDAGQARHALRQAVYVLRRALGAKAIVSRGDDELALAADQLHCDLWAFEAAIDQGRPADALALYRGELLAGFHISAASGFEHWLDQERARVRRLAVEVAWALAAEREREGDAAGTAEAARCAVALVPEDETAIRRLMLLLERLGDRVAAVRAYECFARNLWREFELQPSAETQALVARVRTPEESQVHAPAVQVAGSSIRPRIRAADPPRESEFYSPGLVTEPTPLSSRSRVPRPAAIVSVIVALWLLLGIERRYVRTQTRDHTLPAPRPPPSEVAPGIAVLPFAVQDGSLASWREGLVDLISIDLSGVAALRAIDSRTLLARWRERVRGSEIPELATSLEVAERAGARYAVVGSVVANGPYLFISAGVHEVGGRRMLGTARAQGSPDSIFTLVDRLTLEILRLVLRGEGGELPRMNLAQVSTASLPALKSYLEGEVLFRSSQFQSAAGAYARAVDADSTFALARYRLGLSRQWSWIYVSASLPDPLYAAVGPYADRLPPREAAIFRANLLTEQDLGTAREVLEAEVRRRPDDAETWHELGELYHHYGDQALISPEAADRVFAKAIELDSTFTLPYIHRIYHAISAGDPTRAGQLLGRFTQLAPESPTLSRYRLIAGLAFGDPATRAGAKAALDTLETHDLLRMGHSLEGSRCCWHLSEQVLRKVRERSAELRPDATSELFWVSLAQGKAREALGWVDDPFMPEEGKGMMLLVLDELGLAIPTARLDSALTIGTADSADAVRIFYAGFYAASRARWQALRGLLDRLQSHAQHLRMAGDSSEAGFTEAARQALEGYALWRRGQRDSALVLLEHSQRRAVGNWQRAIVNLRLRLWLGRLLMEMGRPGEALPYFGSLTRTSHPVDYERGRIYEQLGQLERAREAYVLFLVSRQQADPMFQPMIQDSRAALQRLAVATTE